MIKGKKNKSSLKEKRKNIRQTGKKEQRYYIRIDVLVPAIFSIKTKGGVKRVKAHVKNISASGMLVILDKKLSLGTDTVIEMHPPDASNPIHCKGKAVWVVPAQKQDKYQCGIAFTDIEEDNKNTFLKFLCDTIYKTGEGR